MSWRSHMPLMVLGIWGCAISPGWAKPPDLPAKQTITCQPPVMETVGGNASSKDLLVTQEEQESLEPLDLICPCFWEVLWSYGQSWSLSLVEIISGNGGDVHQAPPPAAECPLECPYLRENGTRTQPSPTETGSLPGSVLENLDRLEQAQVLWQKAEESRRQGDWNAASAGYAHIQTLCPGSSFARMATERLDDLHFQAREISQSLPAKAGAEHEPLAQPEKPRK